MKKQQRDAFRVHHMVRAGELTAEFVANKQYSDLLTNRLLASGIEHQLEIMGGAADHVSAETQAEWPSLNRKGMKGARSFIAHEYF